MTVKTRLARIMLYAAIVLFAFGLIFFSEDTSSAAVSGLSLCGRALIPSLFPFFVVSNMAIDSGLAARGSRLFRRPMRFLFNLPGACAPAFILGLCGGYPVGAATAASLYRAGLCSKKQTERLLAFCNNSGPAFILGVCGAALFGGSTAGFLLYGSHVLASVTVGVLFRFYGKEAPTDDILPAAPEDIPAGRLFISSVKAALPSTLNICAYVIFFSVAVKLLYLFGVIPLLGTLLCFLLKPFSVTPLYAEKLIGGFFEVTTGVYGIVSSGAELDAQLCAAAFMLGWAGLSVHFQVLDFIGGCGLSAKPYLLGKLLHGVFSAFYVFVATRLIPFDTQVSKVVTSHISALWDASPLLIFAFSLLSCLAVWGFPALYSRKSLKDKKKARIIKR